MAAFILSAGFRRKILPTARPERERPNHKTYLWLWPEWKRVVVYVSENRANVTYRRSEKFFYQKFEAITATSLSAGKI